MPKKSRTKKKAKKATKKKARKLTKRKPARRVKKAAKKVRKAKKAKPAKKKAKKSRAQATRKPVSAARKEMVKKIAEQVVGKVTHYYDRIGVAVIDVQSSIRLGDTIRLKHGNHEFEQRVESLQVNHTPIDSAARGQEVGMKVNEVAEEGTLILPA